MTSSEGGRGRADRGPAVAGPVSRLRRAGDPMTPPTPQRGVTPASTAPLSAMPGSTVRVTHDPAGTLAAAFHCMAWVRDDRRLCALPVGHAGSHLALPVPWPRKEITPDNPAYTRRTK